MSGGEEPGAIAVAELLLREVRSASFSLLLEDVPDSTRLLLDAVLTGTRLLDAVLTGTRLLDAVLTGT